MRLTHLTACVTLLLAAGQAAAQQRAGDWMSYRDAYRAMVVFEKYGGAKNFIRSHLQVAPRGKVSIDEPLQLHLSGKSVQINLPLDPTGRTVFPLLKAAYDENAVLVLSHRVGAYSVRPRVSIALRADSAYDVPELRAACEQALDFGRYVDPALRSRACAGVRFVFAKKGGEAGARLRKDDGTEQALPVAVGVAFAGDVEGGFPTVTYRFGTGERAQVVTLNAPLAIVPLFE